MLPLASVVPSGLNAEDQARIAMARLLGNESTSVGPDGVDVGLLLAAQAYAIEPDAPSSWSALAGAVTRVPALVGYLPDSAKATTVLAAPNGDIFAVGDERGAVTLWRGMRLEQLEAFAPSLPGAVTALAFSDDGSRLIAGDNTGRCAVWSISNGQLIYSATLPGPVGAVGLDASGLRFAADTDDGVVFGAIGDTPRRLSDQEFASNLLFGADTLTAADGQGRTVTWQLSTGNQISEKSVGFGQPLASAFTRDLRIFAGATLGNEPYIVDSESGNDTSIDVGQTGVSIDAMAFDPSGSTLAMATPSGVLLWDVASKRLRSAALAGIPGARRSSSVSVQRGGRVVAAVGDRGVAVWNLNAGPRLAQRIEPTGISRLDQVPNVARGATSAAFSPQGDLLAWTAVGARLSDGFFVVVWDLISRRERTRFPGEQVISFSPEGNRIATRAFTDPQGMVR